VTYFSGTFPVSRNSRCAAGCGHFSSSTPSSPISPSGLACERSMRGCRIRPTSVTWASFMNSYAARASASVSMPWSMAAL
jgi:hypothetical protein